MTMNATDKVPFLDLVTPHRELREELLAVVDAALATAGFIGGPRVAEFERSFAKFCQARHCVGVGSGTDALRFALVAVGVQPGDVVLTVPNTFIATTEAISQAGAAPNFVDIDERTYTMSPAAVRRYLERECSWSVSERRATNTRTGRPVTAIVPVHLYGQVADMDPILQTATDYNLAVVEDACQAHGASYFSGARSRWLQAGSMGHAAAFSFYPGKNLGACGEAGAITTQDDDIAKTCAMLRDHGQSAKYHHELEGYNGRLDAIQAGMLSVKLPHLPAWNEQRRERARVYDDLLASGGELLVLPHVPDWSRPVYHLYVVRVADRQRVQRDLEAAGIGSGLHYPVPLHLAPPYRLLGYTSGSFPEAERAAAEIVSLPMFPGLPFESQRRVAAALLESCARVGVAPQPVECL